MQEPLDGTPDGLARGGQLVGAADGHPRHVADVVLEDVAGRQRDREQRPAENGRVVEAALRADLDVVGDVGDDLRQLERVEVSRDLVAQGTQELLLPGEPVEVGIGVPEADELECAATRQALVAGRQVDVRVVGRRRADVLVVVAAVDVEPDPAEVVDDLLEPVEVDRDQVVDPEPRQLADRLQ